MKSIDEEWADWHLSQDIVDRIKEHDGDVGWWELVAVEFGVEYVRDLLNDEERLLAFDA